MPATPGGKWLCFCCGPVPVRMKSGRPRHPHSTVPCVGIGLFPPPSGEHGRRWWDGRWQNESLACGRAVSSVQLWVLAEAHAEWHGVLSSRLPFGRAVTAPATHGGGTVPHMSSRRLGVSPLFVVVQTLSCACGCWLYAAPHEPRAFWRSLHLAAVCRHPCYDRDGRCVVCHHTELVEQRLWL